MPEDAAPSSSTSISKRWPFNVKLKLKKKKKKLDVIGETKSESERVSVASAPLMTEPKKKRRVLSFSVLKKNRPSTLSLASFDSASQNNAGLVLDKTKSLDRPEKAPEKKRSFSILRSLRLKRSSNKREDSIPQGVDPVSDASLSSLENKDDGEHKPVQPIGTLQKVLPKLHLHSAEVDSQVCSSADEDYTSSESHPSASMQEDAAISGVPALTTSEPLSYGARRSEHGSDLQSSIMEFTACDEESLLSSTILQDSESSFEGNPDQESCPTVPHPTEFTAVEGATAEADNTQLCNRSGCSLAKDIDRDYPQAPFPSSGDVSLQACDEDLPCDLAEHRLPTKTDFVSDQFPKAASVEQTVAYEGRVRLEPMTNYYLEISSPGVHVVDPPLVHSDASGVSPGLSPAIGSIEIGTPDAERHADSPIRRQEIYQDTLPPNSSLERTLSDLRVARPFHAAEKPPRGLGTNIGEPGMFQVEAGVESCESHGNPAQIVSFEEIHTTSCENLKITEVPSDAHSPDEAGDVASPSPLHVSIEDSRDRSSWNFAIPDLKKPVRIENFHDSDLSQVHASSLFVIGAVARDPVGSYDDLSCSRCPETSCKALYSNQETFSGTRMLSTSVKPHSFSIEEDDESFDELYEDNDLSRNKFETSNDSSRNDDHVCRSRALTPGHDGVAVNDKRDINTVTTPENESQRISDCVFSSTSTEEIIHMPSSYCSTVTKFSECGSDTDIVESSQGSLQTNGSCANNHVGRPLESKPDHASGSPWFETQLLFGSRHSEESKTALDAANNDAPPPPDFDPEAGEFTVLSNPSPADVQTEVTVLHDVNVQDSGTVRDFSFTSSYEVAPNYRVLLRNLGDVLQQDSEDFERSHDERVDDWAVLYLINSDWAMVDFNHSKTKIVDADLEILYED